MVMGYFNIDMLIFHDLVTVYLHIILEKPYHEVKIELDFLARRHWFEACITIHLGSRRNKLGFKRIKISLGHVGIYIELASAVIPQKDTLGKQILRKSTVVKRRA